ncbi:hypothetical protein [Dactylosporangium sp. NPDC005555]|uniref:hypothetical protein n=1 Tax=Dactylosporangium sp. NPDC005555 TaxID=3154889 RepID=UPI0033AB91C5
MPDPNAPVPQWLTTMAQQIAVDLSAAQRRRSSDHWTIQEEMIWYSEWHPFSKASGTYREEESHEKLVLSRTGQLLLCTYTVKRFPPSPEYREK